jgi:hypothetical protein
VVLLELLDFVAPDASYPDGIGLALLVALVAAGYAFVRSWPRPIEQTFSRPTTKIHVFEGDLFEQESHLVISACDTFDTRTPAIIATSSVQGQALTRLFGGDVEGLDSKLNDALANIAPIGQIQKEGKNDRYEIGTVALVNQRERNVYFLAVTEMNENNNARSNADHLWASYRALWKEVRRSSNSGPVAIPVIGGGNSRISSIVPAQDSIRMAALTFIFESREEKVCDELRIVVTSKDFHRLDRLELQAFLASLASS